MFTQLDSLIRRLKAINIDIKLVGNFPWIYITEINGKRIVEKFQAEHGFTIGYCPIRKDQDYRFSDLKEIFKLIRKYK